MSTRARVFLRQNVIGLVALFVALSGTALALPGKNTVDSGDIKAANVKGSDLAPDAVDGSKVLDESLTGSDVKESSLGQVPSAASATQATSATTATAAATAGDSNTLDGLNSTDFLRSNAAAGGDLTGSYPAPTIGPNTIGSGEIRDDSMGANEIGNLEIIAGLAPETCNDSTVGAGGADNCFSGLLAPTPFAIAFTCEDTGAARTAQILIEDANTGETWALDSHGPNGATDQTGLVGTTGLGDRKVLASAGPTASSHFEGGDYMALTAGHVLSGEIAVGTNVFGADCAAAFSFVG